MGVTNQNDVSRWLAPDVLTSLQEAKLRAEFMKKRPFQYFVIDNFLRPDKYSQLLFECQMSKKEPNQSRYGLSHERNINWGAFPNIPFLRMIFSREFRSLLENNVGEAVCPRRKSIPQIAEFLPGSKGFSKHTDYSEPFDLVSLLYLSDPHNPPRGGDFEIHDEKDSGFISLAPLPNRFLVFRIAKNSYHSVSDLASGGGHRMNLTIDWELPGSARAKKRRTAMGGR